MNFTHLFLVSDNLTTKFNQLSLVLLFLSLSYLICRLSRLTFHIICINVYVLMYTIIQHYIYYIVHFMSWLCRTKKTERYITYARNVHLPRHHINKQILFCYAIYGGDFQFYHSRSVIRVKWRNISSIIYWPSKCESI